MKLNRSLKPRIPRKKKRSFKCCVCGAWLSSYNYDDRCMHHNIPNEMVRCRFEPSDNRQFNKLSDVAELGIGYISGVNHDKQP